MIIKILTEDTYGMKFFDELIKCAKEKGIIPKEVKVYSDHIQGICSEKMTRQIKAAINDFDKIIIVVDGDGNPKEKEVIQKEKHFPKDKNSLRKIEIIVPKYEIEEWICHSLEIKFGTHKPSEELHKWSEEKYGIKSGLVYEKKFLPNYVKELDFDKLKGDESFKKFLESLKH